MRLCSHNTAFCREDFIRFFERKVFRTIEKFQMFSPQSRILVAVSGGKDSMALLHFLRKHDFNVDGYYLHLGLGEHSDRSLKKVERFRDRSGIHVIVEQSSDLLKMDVNEAARRLRRPVCAVCGSLKRYLMNRAAVKYDVLATGHNLDDEAATLFGNLLHWQTGYIRRQSAVLEEKGELVRKVKPLVLMSEYETAHYAFFEGLDSVTAKCPWSKNATSIRYKAVLNDLEFRMPGTKERFLKGFLTERESIFSLSADREPELSPCVSCGYLTSAGTCSVCRMRERLKET